MDEKELVKDELADSIVKGKADAALALTNKSLAMGNSVLETLDAMTAAMKIVGDYYQNKKYFLPQVLISANAFDKGFMILQPKLVEGAAAGPKRAKVAIGVCEGDIHDIGKKIVLAMLRGAGFEVIDLGRDVPNSEFIDAVKVQGAQIVAQSALMSTSISEMRDFVQLSKEEGIRDSIKIMIGGGSATPEFAKTIGADGYGKTSGDAVEVAKKMNI